MSDGAGEQGKRIAEVEGNMQSLLGDGSRKSLTEYAALFQSVDALLASVDEDGSSHDVAHEEVTSPQVGGASTGPERMMKSSSVENIPQYQPSSDEEEEMEYKQDQSDISPADSTSPSDPLDKLASKMPEQSSSPYEQQAGLEGST